MLERLISMTLAGGLGCLLMLIFKGLLVRRPNGLYFACLAATALFLFPLRPSLSLNFPLPAEPAAALVAAPAENAPIPADAVDEAPLPAEAPAGHGASSGLAGFTPQELAAALWLLGAAIVFVRYAVSYLPFRRKIMKTALELERRGRVRIVEGQVPSPMLIGFFRPVIVMPEMELSPEERELALCHELTHWRRGDPWVKLLAAAANALHWFNPLSYALVRLMDEACEYACDNAVIRLGGQRRDYGTMLLNMACQSAPILSENMARNKKQLQRRLKLIMKKPKRNVFLTVISAILALCLGLGSVALADSAAPALSSLFNRSYALIGYYRAEKPLYIDGELYINLKEFLFSRSGSSLTGYSPQDSFREDQVSYDGGKITLEVWASELSHGSVPNVYEQTAPEWSAEFYVGQAGIMADGSLYGLEHAPILRDGEVWAPYELLTVLRDIETERNKTVEREHSTRKFNNVSMTVYDNLRDEYRCDSVEIYGLSIMGGDKGDGVYSESNSLAVVSRSGQRTGFRLSTRLEGEADGGRDLEVVLERAVRTFNDGNDLEGLFTVKLDGNTVVSGQTGYINDMPSASDYGAMFVNVEDCLSCVVDFWPSSSVYNAGLMNGAARRGLTPRAARLGGLRVTGLYDTPYVSIAPDTQAANLGLWFSLEDGNSVRVFTPIERGIKAADVTDSGFRSRFFVEKFYKDSDAIRIDAFDGTFTLLDNGTFRLYGDDGRYLVEGDDKGLDLPEGVSFFTGQLMEEIDQGSSIDYVPYDGPSPLPEIANIQ